MALFQIQKSYSGKWEADSGLRVHTDLEGSSLDLFYEEIAVCV